MIASMNKPQELKAHIKGALTNGLTKDELKEVLQVAIYCGLQLLWKILELLKKLLVGLINEE